ncbi:unnamed protein product [Paramecium sonneborni]|uniref:glycerol-3-phosphate dehydrogenase n=1 Tax=Paramecium sonneborni TaxID=65129 RepID=A0A8S1NCJ1_9CILI|nr:unnamed protein product [Paramecium sonneborni]
MNKVAFVTVASLLSQRKVQLQSAGDSRQIYYKLKSREEHIGDALKNEYDVIIVGGGATGAGVSLACANRGLKSIVLEAQDFASGASSKSTKLVHGGVRYMQQVFQLQEKNRMEKWDLVAEALRERSNFLTMCSYLTQDFPTLIPCKNLFDLGYYYFGSLIYHCVYLYYQTGGHTFKPPRIVGKDEIQQHFKFAKCNYGVIYYDGQFNDARMVQEVLATSSLKGQNMVNYVEIKKLIKNEQNKIIGVEAYDQIAQKQFQIKGKCVVNATGGWADNLRLMDDPTVSKRIVSVAGSHLTMPQKYGSRHWGYLIPKTNDGRVLYMVPWLGNMIMGTTERKLDNAIHDPTVSHEEYMWLLKSFCDEFDVDASEVARDVKSKWSGVRPLVYSSNALTTKEVSRTHEIEVSKSGLISVMGGKWTIFRLMGEQTVDKVQQLIGNNQQRIENLPKLVGDWTQFDHRKEIQVMMTMFDLPQSYAAYFLTTYGDRAYDVLKLIYEKPENKESLHPQFPHTVGEILYQIRYEQARKPEDILFRRTRLGFLDQNAIFTVYEKVFQIMAKELKWSDKFQKQFLKENFEYIRKLEF